MAIALRKRPFLARLLMRFGATCIARCDGVGCAGPRRPSVSGGAPRWTGLEGLTASAVKKSVEEASLPLDAAARPPPSVEFWRPPRRPAACNAKKVERHPCDAIPESRSPHGRVSLGGRSSDAPRAEHRQGAQKISAMVVQNLPMRSRSGFEFRRSLIGSDGGVGRSLVTDVRPKPTSRHGVYACAQRFPVEVSLARDGPPELYFASSCELRPAKAAARRRRRRSRCRHSAGPIPPGRAPLASDRDFGDDRDRRCQRAAWSPDEAAR